MTSRPVALILAGPNGAGKTTISTQFVGPDVEFVNADVIGADLRRDDPERPGADFTAGRIVSARLRVLAEEQRSFCFETNLASKGLVGRIDGLRADGYRVALIFVSLPSVDLALARVNARALAGGHDVPAETVRRRFDAGLRYFFTVYRHRVDEWRLYDNASAQAILLAEGRGQDETIYESIHVARLRSIDGSPEQTRMTESGNE